jgi:hypothetical protein
MLPWGIALGLLVGTTAAPVVVIQPLLHANAHHRRMHLVLFLVVLVAKAAGALTPLDPAAVVSVARAGVSVS